MAKCKALIDEAAACGFEAVVFNTDHMGSGAFDGQQIPMWLQVRGAGEGWGWEG